MTVTSFLNSTSTLSSQAYASSVLQNAGGLNGRGVAYLGASRLVRDSNGSIYLIEKIPAEMIGKKILRPLIDKVSTLTSYVFSFIRYLPFPSLPVAYAKEMHSSDETMHFPSQKILVSCLNKHPLTVTQYLSEKGVTEAVAESFADTDKVPIGVELGVAVALYDLNEKLGLTDEVLMIMQRNLMGALKDCATGAKTSEESSTAYNQKNDLEL